MDWFSDILGLVNYFFYHNLVQPLDFKSVIWIILKL